MHLQEASSTVCALDRGLHVRHGTKSILGAGGHLQQDNPMRCLAESNRDHSLLSAHPSSCYNSTTGARYLTHCWPPRDAAALPPWMPRAVDARWHHSLTAVVPAVAPPAPPSTRTVQLAGLPLVCAVLGNATTTRGTGIALRPKLVTLGAADGRARANLLYICPCVPMGRMGE